MKTLELLIKDKKLLSNDLHGRLPHGVMIQRPDLFYPSRMVVEKLVSVDRGRVNDDGVPIEHVKPFLRPLSSMTEDEREELSDLINKEINGDDDDFPFSLYDTTGIRCNLGGERFYFDEMFIVYDWLNAHHFDYRGLIEKGLAIKVTEDNNPYKVQKQNLNKKSKGERH